jgi:hypothetical protein
MWGYGTCEATRQPIANIASNHSRVWMRRGPQESSLLATHCCCQQPSTLCTAQNAQCTTCSTHSKACTQHSNPTKLVACDSLLLIFALTPTGPQGFGHALLLPTPPYTMHSTAHHAQHSTPQTSNSQSQVHHTASQCTAATKQAHKTHM